eukprot:ANDGO_01771.mRNA.1 Steroidogenic acute regulatory-like protein 1
MTDILEILRADVAAIVALCPSPIGAAEGTDPDTASGYEFVKAENGVRVYRKKDAGSAFTAVKGTVVINKPASEVALFIYDTVNHRRLWDDTLQEGRLLDTLLDTAEEKSLIEYALYKSPAMMVSQRDFVTGRYVKKMEDGSWVIVAVSTTHASAPEVKGVVRADTKQSGWVFRPSPEDPNKTFVTSVTAVDPKGWIPAPVVNAVAVKNPLSLAKVRDIIEKQ